jgi:serine/threonine-protein kinase RsbW
MNEVSKTLVARRYSLPSDFTAIAPVCAEVRRLLIERGLGRERFKVELLLREAFINAAQHGNNLDPTKTVDCGITLDGQALEIRMKDQGPGFDWQAAVLNLENNLKKTADPRPGALITDAGGAVVKDLFSEESEAVMLARESGRGFSIIKLYSDGFEFHDSGREVVITKRLEFSADDETPEPADKQTAAFMEIIPATDGLVARLHGSLTAGNLNDVMPPLVAALGTGGVQALMIDMSDAGMIDSKGIGSLIALRKECLRRSCPLRLVKVPGRIMELFRSVNLHRILDLSESV